MTTSELLTFVNNNLEEIIDKTVGFLPNNETCILDDTIFIGEEVDSIAILEHEPIDNELGDGEWDPIIINGKQIWYSIPVGCNL
jgi:hypothetical protein